MRDAQCRKPKWSRTRHKSLESPVPGKRARRVRREAARQSPHLYGIRNLAVQPTLLRVTPHQGGREGRPQSGEGGQVTGYLRAERYAKCKTPKRYWVSSVT